jgi:hypothetical protein
MRQILARVSGWLRNRGHNLRLSSLVLLSALAGVLIGLSLQPSWRGPAPCPDDRSDCTVAESWDESISPLGIEPIFPPAEDVNVGDVFVVLTAENEKSNTSALLARSTKIAHIDMSQDIEDAYSKLPIFPDTAPLPDKEGLPRPQIAAPEGVSVFKAKTPRSTLPLIAFPEFSVQHSRRLGGAVSWAGRIIGLGRSDDELETVSIPEAETYGVDATHALARLDDFCNDAGDLCTDNTARRLLSYLVGKKEVCKVADLCTDNTSRRLLSYLLGQNEMCKESKYVNSIAISLVDRVYLTRSIVQERSAESTAGVQAKILVKLQGQLDQVNEQIQTFSQKKQDETGSNPATSGSSPEALSAQQQALEAERQRLERLIQDASGAVPGVATSAVVTGGNRIALHHMFIRPLVIGIRAVHIQPPAGKGASICP